jgi:DNA-3-methyladenine glycosylase
LDVARESIGKVLIRHTGDGSVAGRIVEAEAYRGPEDLAAHSARGRRTPRTEVMYGPPGYAYVFLVYGLHSHFNVVTGQEGQPHAVLIRAVEPLLGVPLMIERRGVALAPGPRLRLTNGPGKVCEAFAITRDDYGIDLCQAGALYLADGPPPPRVSRSPRIGVDYAGSWARRPWRFFDPASPYVSRAPRKTTPS